MRQVIVVASLLLLAGCTGKKTPVAETNDSTETEEEIPVEQLFLPDTAYASVGKIQYVIEDEDSTAAPLKDLDDRYEKREGVYVFSCDATPVSVVM